MSSIESRAHAFEDDLKSLKEKPSLSGNDFLPLVIKLDDLLTHLQSVSELVSRLSRLQRWAARSSRDTHSGPQRHAKHDVLHAATDVLEEEKLPGAGRQGRFRAAATLQQLAARVARENNKEVALQCSGFDEVPDDFGAPSRTSESRRCAMPSCTASSRRPCAGRGQIPAGHRAADVPGIGGRRLQAHRRG